METYIAGDTTTGKSEVVLKTMAAIGLGFLVEGESVSYPGMVGATFQHPGHKGYAINWGLFPRHDKRLVVVDEAHNENAMDVLPRLNDVRRSGIAKITKACQGTAPARVRKIVVSNPPHQNTTDDYGFNVEIMRDVMKTPEAIARFDLFLCTRNVDTSTTEATAISMDIPEYYGPDLNELIRFIWSRTPDQVVVPDEVVEYIVRESDRLCRKYNGVEIPLIKPGDVQHKIAKMCCSLAGLTLSTRDDDRETIEVRLTHAEYIIAFLETIYDGEGTQYLDYSRFTGRYTRFRDFKDFYDCCGKMREVIGHHNRELIQEINASPVIDTRYISDTWELGQDKVKKVFTEIVRCRLGKRGRGGMFKRTKRGIDVFRFLLKVKDLSQPIDVELAKTHFQKFMV